MGLALKAYDLVGVQKSKQVIIKLCGTDDDWESKECK